MPHHSLYSTYHWPVPGIPMAKVSSAAATTISLSWSVPSGSVDSYVVMWERDTLGVCPVEDRGNRTLTNDSSSYTIEELEEYSNYTITLMAINAAGSAVSNLVTRLTREAGEGLTDNSGNLQDRFLFLSSSVCCPYFSPYIQCHLLQHHCPVGGSGLHPPEWEYNRLFSSPLGTE